jgi:hypothetical protein
LRQGGGLHLTQVAGDVVAGEDFAHLFAVSLVPFATVWIARTELAAVPVAFYAGVFVCVNLAYLVFARQVLNQADGTRIPEHARRLTRRRSLATLVIFASAIIVSAFAPRARFALICCALIPYLTPEVPGAWLVGWIKPAPRRSSAHLGSTGSVGKQPAYFISQEKCRDHCQISFYRCRRVQDFLS